MIDWALGFALAWIVYLLAEQVLLGRARAAVPYRILVTGTRGKSSLVRILAAGARVTEPSACGKITGDVPTLLSPDGDREIRRRGPARLAEQARLLFRCSRNATRCLVVESMTITPELMKAEANLLRPTVAAIVNVRDDHQETLGADPDLQRKAYLDSLPRGCARVTRDPALAPFVSSYDRSLRQPALSFWGRSWLDGLGPLQRDLVELAADVLAELGWDNERSRQAMAAVARQMDNTPRLLSWQQRDFIFLDGFSANDTESLEHLWGAWREDLESARPWSIVLATRADRPVRTSRFCNWISRRNDVDKVYVTGTHRPAALRTLRRQGVSAIDAGHLPAAMEFRDGDPLSAVRSGHSILVGLGNSRGLGLRLRSGIPQRST